MRLTKPFKVIVNIHNEIDGVHLIVALISRVQSFNDVRRGLSAAGIKNPKRSPTPQFRFVTSL